METRQKESMIYAYELEEGVDYEIVSYVVVDKNDHFHTLESFFGINQFELIQKCSNGKEFEEMLQNQIQHVKTGQEYKRIMKTEMIKKPVYFYRLNEPTLDLDLLISLGFGLVELLTEENYGDLFIFDLFYYRTLIFEDGYEWDDPLSSDMAIRISVYTLLTDPTYDDRDLEKILNMNEDLIKLRCLCNGDKIVAALRKVFATKKGGDNVIQFPINQ